MTIKIDGANGLGELPGIQLENDVFLDDTGNDLILGTSNVEKARLTADGKLGIGTTTPIASVETTESFTAGRGVTNGYGFNRNGFNTIALAKDPATDEVVLANVNNSNIRFETFATERMRLTRDGALLVGATSSTAKMHLEDDDTVNFIIRERSVAPSGQSRTGSGITFKEFNNNESAAIHFEHNSATAAKNALVFKVNPFENNVNQLIERARITNDGYFKADPSGAYANVLNNSSLVNQKAHNFFGNSTVEPVVRMDKSSNSGPILQLVASTSYSGTANILQTVGTNSKQFVVRGDSTIINGSGTVASSSDIKIKENIEPASPKLDDIAKINFVNFNKIGDDVKQFGVIAQELEEIFPNLVFDIPDTEEREVTTTDENGNETTSIQTVETGEVTKAVKYSIISLMAVKALQELKAENDELKARVEALENQGA